MSRTILHGRCEDKASGIAGLTAAEHLPFDESRLLTALEGLKIFSAKR